jgi:hypothetical protein
MTNGIDETSTRIGVSKGTDNTARKQAEEGCCQSNANSSLKVARFVNVMRVYAARIRHSAWAAERPCL